MQISTITTKTLKFSELKNLDPITVHIDDTNGKMTIEIYGRSWTAYWSSAKGDVAKFFLSCDNDYLIGCFSRGLESTIVDLDAIPNYLKRLIINERVTGVIDADEARIKFDNLEHVSFDSIEDVRGFRFNMDDWQYDLPTTTNPEYQYLDRIVSAIKEGFSFGVSTCDNQISFGRNRVIDLPEIFNELTTMGEADIRVGQAIYNALRSKGNNERLDRLYSIENDELLKLLRDKR